MPARPNPELMKKLQPSVLVGSLTLSVALHAPAQAVPEQLSYQGHVAVNGTPFTGQGSFKFALVDPNSADTLWSNDGTSGEPVESVVLPVTEGLYSVALGSTTLSNMTVISPQVFANSNVHLRIWFDDGVSGSQQLTPDHPILSVGYAMMAGQVPDGSITAGKIAAGAIDQTTIADGSITADDLDSDSINSGHIIDGEVSTQDIADDAVGSEQLADVIALGDDFSHGRLEIYKNSTGTPSIVLEGTGSEIRTYGSDGLEQIRLHGSNVGQIDLHNGMANNAIGATISAGASGGGFVTLSSSGGSPRASFSGADTGASATFYQSGNSVGIQLLAESSDVLVRNADGEQRLELDGDDGDGAPAIRLLNAKGSSGITLDGDEGDGAPVIWLRNALGGLGISLDGDDNDGAPAIRLRNSNDELAITLDGNEGDGGSGMRLRNANGDLTITLDGDDGDGDGEIRLRNANGDVAITLDADYGGTGRIIADVLEINGADLSERFNISTPEAQLEAGMVVCIDPEKPGSLLLSTRAYDRTAAGIISGAGGVRPGLLMRQQGTLADGQHAVALTGRVYCNVDATVAPIEPGDLITTSDTPGHGMKVTDHASALGAIIGKAMTGLDEGRGQILVLVSLQ